MVTFKLEIDKNAVLTEQEQSLLDKAKLLPVVYDEDSPEMTESMEKAFITARKAKPYDGEMLTLYVSHATLEKVKGMGADYMAILARLLDKAVDEYVRLKYEV